MVFLIKSDPRVKIVHLASRFNFKTKACGGIYKNSFKYIGNIKQVTCSHCKTQYSRNKPQNYQVPKILK